MSSNDSLAGIGLDALLANGDRRTPVVGHEKPPPIPPGGWFGTPQSPGQIAYPPGTITNRFPDETDPDLMTPVI